MRQTNAHNAVLYTDSVDNKINSLFPLISSTPTVIAETAKWHQSLLYTDSGINTVIECDVQWVSLEMLTLSTIDLLRERV